MNRVKSSGLFVIMLDESLNKSNKEKKQIDTHVRFWDSTLTSRYWGSVFIGQLVFDFTLNIYILILILIDMLPLKLYDTAFTI